MILLDTDTLTLLTLGHLQVQQHLDSADEDIAITIVTRIEILRGRFEFLLKAADGIQLQVAQQRLNDTEAQLADVVVIPFDAVAAREFDRLRQEKSLRKIGRADLLISAIALAQRATLVTRNVRHFRMVPGLHVVKWAG